MVVLAKCLDYSECSQLFTKKRNKNLLPLAYHFTFSKFCLLTAFVKNDETCKEFQIATYYLWRCMKLFDDVCYDPHNSLLIPIQTRDS